MGDTPYVSSPFFMTRRFIALFAVSLSLAACSSAPSNVDVNVDGTVKVTTSEGTVTNENKLPDDWPGDVPTYPGATVQVSGVMNPDAEQKGASAMLQTSDAVTDVIAFYKTQMAAQGWTVDATMQLNGGTVMSSSKDDRAMSVSIMPAGDKTTITIGTGQK